MQSFGDAYLTPKLAWYVHEYMLSRGGTHLTHFQQTVWYVHECVLSCGGTHLTQCMVCP